MPDTSQAPKWRTFEELLQDLFIRFERHGETITRRVSEDAAELRADRARIYHEYMEALEKGAPQQRVSHLKAQIDRQDEAEEILFRRAQRTLLTLAADGAIVGFGYLYAGSALHCIPPEYWNFFEFDRERNVAGGSGRSFHGVKFLVWKDIPTDRREQLQQAITDAREGWRDSMFHDNPAAGAKGVSSEEQAAHTCNADEKEKKENCWAEQKKAEAENVAGVMTTAASESRCRKWLLEMMGKGRPEKSKNELREEAVVRFDVGTRAFNRAWDMAIQETGATEWRKPGRKSRHRIDTPD